MAGCVSMPTGGPVGSYSVTQGPGGQNQPFIQDSAQSPRAGWSPTKIVYGFLTAAASIGDQQVARQYLTPEYSRRWQPGWAATVFSTGPNVTADSSVQDSKAKTATVTVKGTVQATLGGFGRYAVPSGSAQQQAQSAVFDLTKNKAGQWRISSTPTELLGLLLNSDQFGNDYQQRNLYFFDPHYKYLVPDPVYVPLQATAADLMQKLVKDLNDQPKDWLNGATQIGRNNGATATAFLPGTIVSGVTLDGRTVTVSLSGTRIGKANDLRMQQISAQLLSTLKGAGQVGPAVHSVVVVVNGRPYTPKNSQGTPVQNTAQFAEPPAAPTGLFYFLDSAGNLWDMVDPQKTPNLIQEHVGKEYSHIAISSGLNGPYIAALRGTALFVGPVGGRLVQRGQGTGYTSVSWDPDGNLWATTAGNQIVMLSGQAIQANQAVQPDSYTVYTSNGTPNGAFTVPFTVPFTGIRVAPDGVRVALIAGGTALEFGAIVPGTGKIQLSPFSVPVPQGTNMFTAVTWYGPDNVITLGEPNQALTEYPVNGGSSTSIQPPPGITSITASSAKYALIAGVGKGGLMFNPSLTGAWASVPLGKETLITPPVYPG
jgi:hypothetical protein